jgi:hypothetical protein
MKSVRRNQERFPGRIVAIIEGHRSITIARECRTSTNFAVRDIGGPFATTASRTLGAMIPPFVLVEGHDLLLFPSLDALVNWVEAQDVRDGVFEAFDGQGRAIDLTADSDEGPVVASPGAHAADRLKVVLAEFVAEVGPLQIEAAAEDLTTVDLAWLLRSVTVYLEGGRPSVW